MKNKISLLAIFGFGLLIGSVCVGVFVYSQKSMGIPSDYIEPLDSELKVVTNISAYSSLDWIQMHRDSERRTLNSNVPLIESCSPDSYETHYFVYRDAWVKSSFSLTITRQHGSIVANWKKLVHNRIEKRFEYLNSERQLVREADWITLRKIIRESRFLEMDPIASDENGYPVMVADGDSWTIESCVNGRYHFANRSTPYGRKDKGFRNVGMAMIKAGGSKYETRGLVVDE